MPKWKCNECKADKPCLLDPQDDQCVPDHCIHGDKVKWVKICETRGK